MYKTFFKLIFIIIFLILSVLIYLSTVGIKTNKFNGLILDKIKEVNPKLNVKLKDVSLLLDLQKKEIKTQTKNTNIYLENNELKLSEINLNIDIYSFIEKKYKIKNLEIITKENSLKNIFNFINFYQFNISLILLQNRIESGLLTSKISLNFNEKDGKLQNYIIQGRVKDANIKLLNDKNLNKISFNFKASNDEYNLKNIKLDYEEIKLESEKIKVIKKNKNYSVEGSFKSQKQTISPKFFLNLLDIDFNDLIKNELVLETDNNFKFNISNKFKVKDLRIKSNLKYEKLILNYNSKIIKNYFNDYKNLIFFKDGYIKIDYSKENLSLKVSSKYSFDKKFDNLKFDILKTNNKYKFNTVINIDNSKITVKPINYIKKKQKSSVLKTEGYYLKNKLINFNKISYLEANNFLNINKIILNKNYKILEIQEIETNFFNENKKLNNLSLKKNKNNYLLLGESFDASELINSNLKSDEDDNFFTIFENLNSKLSIDINTVYLDEDSYLENLNGLIVLNKNIIKSANLDSSFPNNDKFIFSIKTNNSEKVTTLFSENAEPFVKKFDFIKGFTGGKIDFYSVKKNNHSKSKINIFNFKLKEVPALATLLSLASLQGIADLMTGEGIRFDEFEMTFESKDKLININEIYSIGPAISILMNGYIQQDELVSLRGTLVPATTINNVIGKIKILGDILIGTKKGEGVFGVSFKIKGPPKNLKTTVNPIKTLTPRFITRTLEKIKKEN